jgi:hypothetical protein
MAKSKMDQHGWDELIAAYQCWDPTDPNGGSVNDLVAEHGVSKQALYYQLQRRGIPLRNNNGRTIPVTGNNIEAEGVQVLVDLLVEARMEQARLTALLEAHGVRH